MHASTESFASVAELASAVNAWCSRHGIEPLNGQAASSLNERSIRYYRTLGLVSGPDGGGSRAYGELHFLQLAAIRLLQSQGLPLRKIQELLYGRAIEELREVLRRGRRELPVRRESSAGFAPFEQWQLIGLTEDFALVSRSGTIPSPAQIESIRQILAAEAPSAPAVS